MTFDASLLAVDEPVYRPAIEIRGSNTRGRPSRCFGIKAQRPLHALSGAETLAQTLAEFDPRVESIREQFPLCAEEISTIRLQMGFTRGSGAGRFGPSLDLLLGLDCGEQVAVEVKRCLIDFEEHKTAERMAVKRCFLKARGIPLVLFAHDQVHPQVALNLASLRTSACFGVSAAALDRWVDEFQNGYARDPFLTIRELIDGVTGDGDHESSVHCFRRAVWEKWIFADLTQPLRFDRPLVLCRDRSMGVALPW